MRDPTGISVLDYFAAHALAGVLANTSRQWQVPNAVDVAYNAATLMLAERERRAAK
jgi:hypothetical protein